MKKFRVLVNGNEYEVAIEEIKEQGQEAVVREPVKTAPKPAQPKAVAAPTPKKVESSSAPAAEAAADGVVVAAMPGTIADIKVANGDQVTKGQTLLILEAMKMENEIMAPCDGVVDSIKVEKGASVNAGDILVALS